MTVQFLRQHGHKVRVTHKRYIKREDTYWNLEIKRKGDKLGELVFPKGGGTLVEITTPKGENYSEYVRCHMKDVYNKKIGVKIGIGRIMAEIERKNSAFYEVTAGHVDKIAKECAKVIAADVLEKFKRTDGPLPATLKAAITDTKKFEEHLSNTLEIVDNTSLPAGEYKIDTIREDDEEEM